MKLAFSVEFDRKEIEQAILDAAYSVLPHKDGYKVVVKISGYDYSLKATASLEKEEEVE